MRDEVIQHYQSREDGQLESPTRARVEKLAKALAARETELQLKNELLKKYEQFQKPEKAANNRLQAKGRLFGPKEITRLEKEEVEKAEERAKKRTIQDYLNGEHLPEIDAANTEYFVLNPGELHESHGPYCHVLRVNWQGAGPHVPGFEWDGSSVTCGGGRKPHFIAPRYEFEVEMGYELKYRY
ncbi:hypothetical protein BDV95DRAFT_580331 [Massariosphaeria phaeospora]|uniref:Uncharacterized protein n=1 Tax=Massariosphaeria phaeospora TaxID=100035 RepID=A0A7C8I8Y6_9PLEO|nr:hypothetical protein BDV95DRAFT_580331 [Massariosphaeria phaeospora]